MKVLELIHALEEAYDRFGDIEIKIKWNRDVAFGNLEGGPPIRIIDNAILLPKELIIESEEFIIKCEK